MRRAQLLLALDQLRAGGERLGLQLAAAHGAAGTGAYRGARGTALVTDVGSSTTTITVTLPAA